jgi:hypothetical protein
MCANHSAAGAGSGLDCGTGTSTGIDMTSQSSRPASLRDGRTSIPASAIRRSILSRPLGVQHLVAEQVLEPIRPHPAHPSLADPYRLGNCLYNLGRVFLSRHAASLPLTLTMSSTAIPVRSCRPLPASSWRLGRFLTNMGRCRGGSSARQGPTSDEMMHATPAEILPHSPSLTGRFVASAQPSAGIRRSTHSVKTVLGGGTQVQPLRRRMLTLQRTRSVAGRDHGEPVVPVRQQCGPLGDERDGCWRRGPRRVSSESSRAGQRPDLVVAGDNAGDYSGMSVLINIAESAG